MTKTVAAQERERGRTLRHTLPRRAHDTLTLSDRRDPLGILAEQHRSRLAELVPVRIGRMLQSPFTYYRGSAGPMAFDLRYDTSTDLRVVSCGDAHISNFGLFASPERRLLFDLNDFDEGGIAPFEWDVKRMAASVHIGGRDNGLSEQQCRESTQSSVAAYQRALRDFMDASILDRYYFQVDTDSIEAQLTDPDDLRLTRRAVKKARGRTADQVLAKITTTGSEGTLRIVDEPPVTRHVEHASMGDAVGLFDDYRRTLREDASAILGQFTMRDYVLRVVGVGSVGTRCYVLMLVGPGGEAMFLQAKEAQPSVLVTYGGMPDVLPGNPSAPVEGEGQRVVAAQRILQAQSDPFLGWIIGWAGEQEDRPRVDYYWRQFRDMKGSIDLQRLNARAYTTYAGVCARLLARAHAQSPAAHAVTGYLGRGGRFAEAVADWSRDYADVCEADFEALEKAVAAGRFPVERGV